MKTVVRLIFLAFIISSCKPDTESGNLPTAPSLNNNPSLGVIVTNSHPLLSFFNSHGGMGTLTYEMQLDTSAGFNSSALIQINDIHTETQFVSSVRLGDDYVLMDKSRYFWRVRAKDSKGKTSDWQQTWFDVDTEADDHFMNLVRLPVKEVRVSSGENPKNICDLDDAGQTTFWEAVPPGLIEQWIEFDLGEEKDVSRIWMFTDPSTVEGWLKDFAWEMSLDGSEWTTIPGGAFAENDIFRNIIDIAPVKARYMRLVISEFYGYAPKINTIIFYSPVNPPVPETPDGDYVLLVGNQMNGYTFTDLAGFIDGLDMGLKTLRVPHYEVSMEMIKNLKHPPVAIILSGNNADYPNLPMFEYNGEYEIIREGKIPLLGICCGHQQLAMAYGYTFARSMGWSDISSLEPLKKRTSIHIVREDELFEGIPNPFTAPEIHGWAVAVIPDGFEVLAESSYIQAIGNKERATYGEQFHAEIKVPFNQGTPYLVNFLKMAMNEHEHSIE